MKTHRWRWDGQGERFAFGDPAKVYVVDVWVCSRCHKEISTRNDPKPGHCNGRYSE